jgi:hypothetical protein
VAIFATVRQRVSRGITEARWRTMDDLGDQGKRKHCSRPHAGREQEISKIFRTPFVSRRYSAA